MTSLIKLHTVVAASRKKDVRRSSWFRALGRKQQSEYLKLHKAHAEKHWASEPRDNLSRFHSEQAEFHTERVVTLSRHYPSNAGPVSKLARQLKSFHTRQRDLHRQEASQWRKKKGK